MYIAVDGPSGVGKGTLAKALATKYGFAFLDTGLLYRRVALAVLLEKQNPEEEDQAFQALNRMDAVSPDHEDLRTPFVSQAASQVAKHPKVRAGLLSYQRTFAEQALKTHGGAVLDGRDIGTVILPQAEKKLYLTAHTEVRAERRLAELLEKGEDATFDQVLADLKARDKRDQERAHAPLKLAPDAHLLDTSHLDKAEVLAAAISYVEK